MPSPTQTGTREPYADYTVYRSNDPRAPDFRFEHPAGWAVREPDVSEDSKRWTYQFEHRPSVEPAVETCPSFVRIELTVGRAETISSFPPSEEERGVAGEQAAVSIYTRGDPVLDQINDDIDRRRCLTMATRAHIPHEGTDYVIAMYSTLEEPDLDVAAFEHLLDTFDFLP